MFGEAGHNTNIICPKCGYWFDVETAEYLDFAQGQPIMTNSNYPKLSGVVGYVIEADAEHKTAKIIFPMYDKPAHFDVLRFDQMRPYRR